VIRPVQGVVFIFFSIFDHLLFSGKAAKDIAHCYELAAQKLETSRQARRVISNLRRAITGEALSIDLAALDSRPIRQICLDVWQLEQRGKKSKRRMRDAIEFHLEGLRLEGQPVPVPRSEATCCEIA
jgi:hypothetical protein